MEQPGSSRTPTIVIRPTEGWVHLGLAELWQYRELIYLLIMRDIKVRYKQTVLGASWAILQPALLMVAFTLVFSELIGVSGDGSPYPVFAYVALVPWTYFSSALGQGSSSVVANTSVITKVYFPRLVTPLAAVLSGLLDFSLAFIILVGLLAYYAILPPWQIIFLPLFAAMAVATALGVSLWISAIGVKYRDVRYAMTFVTQLWMFMTPIAYPVSLVPESLRPIYGLNPMAGVVEGFRWTLLGQDEPQGMLIAASAGMVTLLLVSGAYFFRRMERSFADVI